MTNQFEVWRFIFPDKGGHPVVVISHPDRCARMEVLNVLYCKPEAKSFREAL